MMRLAMDDMSSCSWGRILHWGPLFTLGKYLFRYYLLKITLHKFLVFLVKGIVKTVVWSTMHCNSMWWPPSYSIWGFVNSIIFIFVSGSTLYNFLFSLYIGPGHLPLNWKPVRKLNSTYHI